MLSIPSCAVPSSRTRRNAKLPNIPVATQSREKDCEVTRELFSCAEHAPIYCQPCLYPGIAIGCTMQPQLIGSHVPANSFMSVPTTAGHHTEELMLTLGTFSLAQEGIVVT